MISGVFLMVSGAIFDGFDGAFVVALAQRVAPAGSRCEYLYHDPSPGGASSA